MIWYFVSNAVKFFYKCDLSKMSKSVQNLLGLLYVIQIYYNKFKETFKYIVNICKVAKSAVLNRCKYWQYIFYNRLWRRATGREPTMCFSSCITVTVK